MIYLHSKRKQNKKKNVEKEKWPKQKGKYNFVCYKIKTGQHEEKRSEKQRQRQNKAKTNFVIQSDFIL